MHSTLYSLISCTTHCNFVFLSPTHRNKRTYLPLQKSGPPVSSLPLLLPPSAPARPVASSVHGGAHTPSAAPCTSLHATPLKRDKPRTRRPRRSSRIPAAAAPRSPAELENDDGGGHGGATSLSIVRRRRRPRHQGGTAEPPQRAPTWWPRRGGLRRRPAARTPWRGGAGSAGGPPTSLSRIGRYRMAQDSDDFLFIFDIVACVWIVILAIVALLC